MIISDESVFFMKDIIVDFICMAVCLVEYKAFTKLDIQVSYVKLRMIDIKVCQGFLLVSVFFVMSKYVWVSDWFNFLVFKETVSVCSVSAN